MRTVLIATALTFLPAIAWAEDGLQWNGFYVGATIGSLQHQTTPNGEAESSFNLDRLYGGDDSAIAGGIFAGGSFTHGVVMFGAEAGLQLTNIETSGQSSFTSASVGTFFPRFGPSQTIRRVTKVSADATTEADWLATARTRIGRQFDRFTPYASLGVVAVQRKTTTTVRSDTTTTTTIGGGGNVTNTTENSSSLAYETLTARTLAPSLGLGVDWKVTSNLIARADVQYHFVGADVTLDSGNVGIKYDDIPAFSLGLAYKF